MQRPSPQLLLLGWPLHLLQTSRCACSSLVSMLFGCGPLRFSYTSSGCCLHLSPKLCLLGCQLSLTLCSPKARLPSAQQAPRCHTLHFGWASACAGRELNANFTCSLLGLSLQLLSCLLSESSLWPVPLSKV